MIPFPLSVHRLPPVDRCEHCDDLVSRVWLVPGDVLDSCATCFEQAVGHPPVHEHGHTSQRVEPGRQPWPGGPVSFHLRADGRRPA